jgi:hypothetical protein
MSALIYIIRKSMKNNIKEILRKPGKLVLYIIVLAFIAWFVVSSVIGLFDPVEIDMDDISPMFFLMGIIFVFIAFLVVTYLLSGLSGGDAIFGMNDVNMLFVSPVNPRKILLYGIARTAKTAFWAGFFILFQTALFANFGVAYGGVLLTFAGYALSMLVLTIASLLVYSVTNGRPFRKKVVKGFTAALFLPLVIYSAVQYINTQDAAATVEAAVNSPFMRYLPVAGWTASGVIAFLSGEMLSGVMFFGLNVLLGAGLTIYIILSNPDYYEDALVATETAYEKARAVDEGNINAVTVSNKKVKVTKTGISGSGASALFGKHIRESFRQSRFGFLTWMSVIFVAGAAAASFFFGDLLTLMSIMMFMLVFLIGTGRGLKETYSHYIYMIPESSFKKILWSNMEIMLKTLIESVLIFGISGAVIGASPLMIIACIIAYTLFALLLLGVNYLSMRYTGANMSTGLLVTIYFLSILLAAAPGIVMGIVAGSIIGGDIGVIIGLLVLAGWELAAGLGCFALSKGVLHDCDMISMKQWGERA